MTMHAVLHGQTCTYAGGSIVGRKTMGIYAKYVLPRLIDLTMRNKDTARLRAEWVPQACGEVLEVGIGSGLNLPFYSSQVQRVRGRSFPGTPAYASQESRSATDQGRFFVTVG